jgi:uncharacterized protein (TIGR01777 family)
MSKIIYEKASRMEASLQELFCWHTRPGALERLTPPFMQIKILEPAKGIQDGCRARMEIKYGPYKKEWLAEHRDYAENQQFKDIQLSGPFRHWEHTHLFAEGDGHICILRDHVEFELPLSFISHPLLKSYIKRKLEILFAYRHRVLFNDLEAHKSARGDEMPRRILIAGGSGFVGRHLIPFLTTGGHEVYRLVRNKKNLQKTDIYWNPAEEELAPETIEGFDAVINLAGESISQGRWTPEIKKRILASRIDSTGLLARTMAQLKHKPRVFLSASAVGYYGDKDEEIMNRDKAPGKGFLSEVCWKWEQAANPAREAGIRVVHPRLGVVLSPDGGMLQQLLPVMKWGVGGTIGTGKQYMSWIAIDDLIYAFHYILHHQGIQGAVNLVSPNPVTNAEFTRILGRVMRRPTLFSTPAIVLKTIFGEMAEEFILADSKIHPAQLLHSQYEFAYPDLEGALRHLLGR